MACFKCFKKIKESNVQMESKVCHDLTDLTDECPAFTLSGLKVLAKVVRVIDGDTIDCCFSSHGMKPTKWRLRMLGYDACETRTRDRVEKLHGIATTLMLKQKILDQIVQVEFKNADKFGRWLGTVYFNGVNINQWVLDNSPSVPYNGGTRKKKL